MSKSERILALLTACKREFSSSEIMNICNIWMLYPVISQLEEKGLVTSRWGEPVRPDGPRRRLYRLS